MGWNTIIYTAALSNVNTELHEAAQIDGASRFSRVIHIDFPTILPTAVIMLILSSGNIMTVGFEKVYLMQNKLNLSTSEVISTYVYKVGLTQGSSDYSYASAIGLFNSLVNMLLLVLVNASARKFSDSSLW
jgi:putative aldouronate transport system permease protein